MMMHLRLQGRLERVNGTTRIRVAGTNQVFILKGKMSEDLREESEVDLQVHFDAKEVPKWGKAKIVEVIVDKVIRRDEENE